MTMPAVFQTEDGPFTVVWQPIVPRGFDPVAVARFVRYVDISGGSSACWPWTGARMGRHGYGHFTIGSRSIPASRFSLELALGRRLAAGMLACHTCDNPPCCNPLHLYEGTPSDNARDAMDRGQWSPPAFVTRPRPDQMARGTQVNTAKLTEALVREIRRQYAGGLSSTRLAAAYGVVPSTIQRIVKRTYWAHVR